MEHVYDPEKLVLLEQRMRSSLPPTKTPRSSETKPPSVTTDTDDGRMLAEVPKIQYNNILPLNMNQNNVMQIEEPLSGSEKENGSAFLAMETNLKMDENPVNAQKDAHSDHKVDTDVSYQSANLRGSNGTKKRKFDKVETTDKNNNNNNNDSLELKTKKTKLTLPQAPTGPAIMLKIPGREQLSSNSFEENEPIKETPGLKKISDFFQKATPAEKTKTTKTLVVKTRGKSTATVEKKLDMSEAKEFSDDRKELTGRIMELEEKVENSKKERERDHIRAEKELRSCEEKFDNYKATVHKIIAKNVLEIENYKRNERKSLLDRQRQRLGEYVSQREGSKFIDVWSDGSELRSVKEKLENITREKEELEKQKKNLKSKKPTMNSSTPKSMLPLESANENCDSNSNTDVREQKERMNAKITMLQREENILRDQLEKLEVEKITFYQQYKKQYEEDHSRYGKPNQETNAPAWPILNERYQLLSLLGKGGFSEVYKAYDLEELCFVACKVHQLNPNWTENAKSNYVKHATREFEVHKELIHPNIVRLFDCINIDEHSFATILDYCEGPDLSMYLKQHKSLPERDARTIIKQILAGLKYLSAKIIHYDLKPQNVLFHKGEVKISDFGLCKIVESDVSRIELTSQGVGTYWYLPPECFQMDDQPPLINSKVDVWSVGVMYYEMLFGMRPFGHGMSQEKILKEKVILKSHSVNFPTKPAISPESRDFIKKCLAYNQDDRIDIDEAYEMLYHPKK